MEMNPLVTCFKQVIWGRVLLFRLRNQTFRKSCTIGEGRLLLTFPSVAPNTPRLPPLGKNS
jgi:hypothetical protein